MWQTWKLNPELADMQHFPHKFCRSNSHSKQDDIHGAPSKTINIRNVNQNKKLVWRSRSSLNEDPIVVYKPSNAGTVFQNTVFSHKNCRFNWETYTGQNQWHEFDESKSSNWTFAGTSLIRIGVGDLKQFHRAPILHVWSLSFDLRRRMEIRNKLFQKISLNKIT